MERALRTKKNSPQQQQNADTTSSSCNPTSTAKTENKITAVVAPYCAIKMQLKHTRLPGEITPNTNQTGARRPRAFPGECQGENAPRRSAVVNQVLPMRNQAPVILIKWEGVEQSNTRPATHWMPNTLSRGGFSLSRSSCFTSLAL